MLIDIPSEWKLIHTGSWGIADVKVWFFIIYVPNSYFNFASYSCIDAVHILYGLLCLKEEYVINHMYGRGWRHWSLRTEKGDLSQIPLFQEWWLLLRSNAAPYPREIWQLWPRWWHQFGKGHSQTHLRKENVAQQSTSTERTHLALCRPTSKGWFLKSQWAEMMSQKIRLQYICMVIFLFKIIWYLPSGYFTYIKVAKWHQYIKVAFWKFQIHINIQFNVPAIKIYLGYIA